MPIDFQKELDTTRQNFIKAGRRIGLLPRPDWLDSDDTLSRIYDELSELEATGEIHYGALVQANEYLFNEHPAYNLPANIVFSANTYYEQNPGELREVASEIFDHKGLDNAPEHLRQVVDAVTDEYERLYNIRLPMHERPESFFTTIIVFRKHLPGRKLQGSIFPVLTNPDKLKSTLILPMRYWTDELVSYFEEG